ncbi:MAG: hypothetical protein R2824_30700 [Saprospiraceae bacterium]
MAIYLVIAIDKYIFRKIEDLFIKNKHWITYESGKFEVDGEEGKRIYQLNRTGSLVISYHKLKYENSTAEYDFFLSTISFIYDQQEVKLFFLTSKKSYLKLCSALYQDGIVFKEYFSRRRVFLGRTPKYKEIQQLKAKYGFDW